ncbi:hypothetical protein [Ferrovibrio sp.]|uniref:hypothetical protein n=1 Tax=Ferrovibrio sp. TaxID=1917215 RepID=UPI001B5FA4C8|nr:hypothetical protein [Ferrovibrio sp.]MBP7065531.1 hypothetical protein [Ferrovibrio sp.]
MLNSLSAGRIIVNRGELRQRAVNFRSGQELRLTPELRGKIEKVIVETQSDFEQAARESLRNMRDALTSASFNQVGRASYYEWIHDLAVEMKGQGGLFNYPLLSVYADILKQLTANLTESNQRLHKIIGLNIDAIGVVVTRKLTGPGGSVERKVAEALREANQRFRLGSGGATTGLERKVASAIRKLDGKPEIRPGNEVLPPLNDTARQWPTGRRVPVN